MTRFIVPVSPFMLLRGVTSPAIAQRVVDVSDGTSVYAEFGWLRVRCLGCKLAVDSGETAEFIGEAKPFKAVVKGAGRLLVVYVVDKPFVKSVVEDVVAVRVVETGDVITLDSPLARVEETDEGLRWLLDDGVDMDYKDFAIDAKLTITLHKGTTVRPAIHVRMWSLTHSYSYELLLNGKPVKTAKPATRPRLEAEALIALDGSIIETRA